MSSRLKVLLVLGHPRKDSLCGALADAFAAGARQAGVDLRRLDLCELQFNPNVVAGSPRNQALEPAIREAVELVRWADHLVFVFPTWWGTMPAPSRTCSRSAGWRLPFAPARRNVSRR